MKKVFVIWLVTGLMAQGSSAHNRAVHREMNVRIASLDDIRGFSLDKFLKGQLSLSSGIATTLICDDVTACEDSPSTIRGLLGQGGSDEDGPTKLPYLRSRNHFHNPLKAVGDAFYTDSATSVFFEGGRKFCQQSLPPVVDPVSSVRWLSEHQVPPAGSIVALWNLCNATENLSPVLGVTDWSWRATRASFFESLTRSFPADRDAQLARVFLGLGHLMHLVEDAAVPSHSRNTYHDNNGDSPFEDFVEGTLKSRPNPVDDGLHKHLFATYMCRL